MPRLCGIFLINWQWSIPPCFCQFHIICGNNIPLFLILTWNPGNIRSLSNLHFSLFFAVDSQTEPKSSPEDPSGEILDRNSQESQCALWARSCSNGGKTNFQSCRLVKGRSLRIVLLNMSAGESWLYANMGKDCFTDLFKPGLFIIESSLVMGHVPTHPFPEASPDPKLTLTLKCSPYSSSV